MSKAILPGRTGYPVRGGSLEYPLQRAGLQWALVTGLGGGVLFWSPLIGLGFFVLGAGVGMLWRRDEPPALAACIAYQWAAVMIGYLFFKVNGVYPGMAVGSLDSAVFLSLLGMSVLVLGARAGLSTATHRGRSGEQVTAVGGPWYDVRRLFWLVILLSTTNWFVEIRPMEVFFDGAQLLYRLLEFRGVFLMLLLLTVFEQRSGYGYAAVALSYALLPSLSSTGSAFSSILILLIVTTLSQWRPWAGSRMERLRTSRVAIVSAALIVVLTFSYLVWEGGLKPRWREYVASGQVNGRPTQMLRAFLGTVEGTLLHIDWVVAPYALAARASSGVGYFSHVVDRVPNVVPHERGGLTLRALRHIAMPRFLFRDKPNLGSDSWLVRTYAGLPAAGAERGTSIGLGYMAEFFIDFGAPGMFVPIFVYGFLIGVIYCTLRRFCPSKLFYTSAVTVMVLPHLMTYDGEIAKVVGGFVQAFVVFAILLRILGPWLHGSLVSAPSYFPIWRSIPAVTKA